MISHRQNRVLQILTIFSVVLLPLTLISGIFGMNVNFPGYGTHAAFWVIVGVMVGDDRRAWSASSAGGAGSRQLTHLGLPRRPTQRRR